MFNAFANDKTFTFKTVGIGSVAADKHLAHGGFHCARCICDITVVYRHIAPAEQGLAFFGDDAGKNGFAFGAVVCVLWQKYLAHGVATYGWQGHAEFGGFFTHEGVWHLHQQTGAIAQFGVIPGRTAVRQVIQQLQALGDNVMTFLAFDMGHKTNATAVFLMASVI